MCSLFVFMLARLVPTCETYARKLRFCTAGRDSEIHCSKLGKSKKSLGKSKKCFGISKTNLGNSKKIIRKSNICRGISKKFKNLFKTNHPYSPASVPSPASGCLALLKSNLLKTYVRPVKTLQNHIWGRPKTRKFLEIPRNS